MRRKQLEDCFKAVHKVRGTNSLYNQNKTDEEKKKKKQGERNNRSYFMDKQPIRLPDELQLSHKPQNRDKHTPVSPVHLPQTPLNDCKH